MYTNVKRKTNTRNAKDLPSVGGGTEEYEVVRFRSRGLGDGIWMGLFVGVGVRKCSSWSD